MADPPRTTDVAFESRDLDAAWDSFVASSPGGHHVQTSRWGSVKSTLGWRAVRVVVRQEERVVAGCQILLRDVPRVGAVAYAPRGPLVPGGEPVLLDRLVTGLHELADRERIVFLKAQPPADHWELETRLRAMGFRPSALEAGPSATVLVDLSRPEEDLLGAMRAGARSNIRKARRKGVTVRVGGRDDLGVFMRLVEHTSSRQGFSPYPPRYYRAMWERFAVDGHARFLLAEHDGRVLSAVLVIAFGDCATYKMGGWSGERGAVHPNELLHWEAMRWARAQGFRHYDLEGIPTAVGRALARGEAPEAARRGTAHFKLGFGGEVALLPGAADYAYRPLVAALAARLSPWLSRSGVVVQRLLGRDA